MAVTDMVVRTVCGGRKKERWREGAGEDPANCFPCFYLERDGVNFALAQVHWLCKTAREPEVGGVDPLFTDRRAYTAYLYITGSISKLSECNPTSP